MYYEVTLVDRVRVPPRMFEMERDEAIRHLLQEKYARTIQRDFGFVIEVLSAKALSKGIVIPGDPNIYYDVEFKLLVFSLEVNEVFKGKVSEVMEFGAFVNIGPFEGLLHVSQIGREKFIYNKRSKSLSDPKGKLVLKKGDTVFVKCSTVSMRSSSDVKISLTMRDDGLGKEEWLVLPKEKEEKTTKKKK